MKCKEQVWHRNEWRPSPCSRNAVGDTGYCKQHNPKTVAAKHKERHAKYQERFSEEMRIHRLHGAAPDMLEALEAISPMLPRSLTTAHHGDPVWTEAIRKVEAAIKKARGEK